MRGGRRPDRGEPYRLGVQILRLGGPHLHVGASPADDVGDHLPVHARAYGYQYACRECRFYPLLRTDARRLGVHRAKMGRSVHAGKPKGRPRLGREAPVARRIREGRPASTATVNDLTGWSRSDDTWGPDPSFMPLRVGEGSILPGLAPPVRCAAVGEVSGATPGGATPAVFSRSSMELFPRTCLRGIQRGGDRRSSRHGHGLKSTGDVAGLAEAYQCLAGGGIGALPHDERW